VHAAFLMGNQNSADFAGVHGRPQPQKFAFDPGKFQNKVRVMGIVKQDPLLCLFRVDLISGGVLREPLVASHCFVGTLTAFHEHEM
jgi:hypothetical protein